MDCILLIFCQHKTEVYAMYILLRSALFLALLVMYISLRRKLNINRAHSFFLLILLLIVFGFISELPIENVFYSFKSPKEAFSYKYSQTVADVVEGTNSAMVLSKNDGEVEKYEILSKSKDGWKLSNKLSVRRIIRQFYGMTYVEIYQCGKSDYYLFVYAYDTSTISDNKGSNFKSSSHMAGQTVVTSAYAYVNNLSDYCLFLDGTRVDIIC